MIRSALLRRLLTGATICAGATVLMIVVRPAHAQTAFVITGSGSTLSRFDIATPGVVTTVGNFSGASNEVDGIDFRVSDGLLYGYSQASNQVVTINLTTAVTTAVSVPTTGSTTSDLGIDFNPVADRLRIVNTSDQNLRVNVATGATTVDGTLAYASGDRNFGVNPNIIEAAYTNSIAGATSTQIYYIDSALGTLVTTTDANSGTLTTVGSLGFTIDNQTGFDILTGPGGTNTAYAKFRVSGVNGLYSVNLNTGNATLLGNLGIASVTGNQSFGLAVTAAPEPGSIALVGAGLLGVAGTVVRRRRAS